MSLQESVSIEEYRDAAPQDYAQLMRELSESRRKSGSFEKWAQPLLQRGIDPRPFQGYYDQRREEDTETFFGGLWRGLTGGGASRYVPFVGSASEAFHLYDVKQAAERLEQGAGTEADYEVLVGFIQEARRAKGVGFTVGNILSQLPAFMGEFLATGGLYTAGKKGAFKLLGKTVKEGIEEGVEAGAQATTRKILNESIGLKGMEMAAGRTALNVPRAAESTVRAMLPEMGLSEDEAGRAMVVFGETGREFWDALGKGYRDMLIEHYSEGVGAALTLAMGKVLSRAPGATLTKLEQVARKGGWNGVLEEMGEERVGDALRALVGDIPASEIIPSGEQLAAEAIAFGIGGTAIRTAGKILEPAPLPEDGFESVEAPPVEEVSAAMDQFAAGAETPLGDIEFVQPKEDNELAAEAKEFIEAGGGRLHWIRRRDGQPMTRAAGTMGDVVLMDAQQGAGIQRKAVLYYELSHLLKNNLPGDWRRQWQTFRAADPQGVRKARQLVKERFGDLSSDAAQDETHGMYAHYLAGWLELALTEDGHLEVLAQEDPGTFRRVMEALKDFFARLPLLKSTEWAENRRLFEEKRREAIEAEQSFRQVSDLAPEEALALAKSARESFDLLINKVAAQREEAATAEAPPEAQAPAASEVEIPEAEPSTATEPVKKVAPTLKPRETPSKPAQVAATKPLTGRQQRLLRKRYNQREKRARELEAAGRLDEAEAIREELKRVRQERGDLRAATPKVPEEASIRQRKAVVPREQRRPVPTRQERAIEAFEEGEEGAMRFAPAPPVESDAFKTWFGTSKVVGPDGEPLVLYHGTRARHPITRFIPGFGFLGTDESVGAEAGAGDWWLGMGVYMTPETRILDFYGGEQFGNIYPLFARITNPVELEVQLETDKPRIFRRWMQREFAEEGPNGDILSFEPEEYDYENPEQAAELTRAMMRLGYDGVIMRAKSDKSYDEYVAFDRSQIKSALGNVGSFSRKSADIRFAPALSPQYYVGRHLFEDQEGPDSTWKERMYRQWVDSTQPLRGYMAQWEADNDRTIPEKLNTMLRNTLRRGRTKYRLVQAEREHIKPILDTIKKLKVTMSAAGDYIMARHAPERNELMRKRTDGELEAGSGYTDLEAQQILDRAHASDQAGLWMQLGRQWDAMNREKNRLQVKYGLVSQEQVDSLNEQFEHWAPLRTLFKSTDFENAIALDVASGLNIRGREFKQAFGRTTPADHPIEFGFTAFQSAIVRGEKNLVGQTLLDFFSQFPDSKVVQIDAKQTKWELDKKTGVRRRTGDPDWHRGPNVIGVKKDGVQHALTFAPAYANIPIGLKNLHAEQMGEFMQLMGRINRGLAGLATRWNPAFFPFNMLRDWAAAGAVSWMEHGSAFARKMSSPRSIARAFQAMYRGTGDWAQHAEDFKKRGGPISFLDLKNVSEQIKAIENEMKAASGSPMAKLKAGWRQYFHWWGELNDAAENATRLSYYVHAVEDLKMTPDQAAAKAKDLTVNFERKGDRATLLNALYIFANANIQGTDRLFRAIKKVGPKRAAKVLGTIATAGAIMELVNHAIAGDDDDGVNHYEKMPRHIKERSMVLMDPMGGGGGFVLPMPYGFTFFHNLGRAAMSLFHGGEPDEAIASMMSTALDSFSPIGLGGSMDSWVAAATPTLARPLVEISLNQDWAGRPISPENLPFGFQKPDSERYFRNVNPLAKGFAQTVNALGGGDKGKPGSWFWGSISTDVSPESIEHVIKTYGSGAGRTYQRLLKLMSAPFSETEVTLQQDVPIARRLFYEKSPYADRGTLSRNLEEVEALTTRLDLYQGTDAALELRQNPLFRLRGKARFTRRALKRADQQVERGVPGAEERVQNIITDFNRAFAEANQ